MELSERKIAEIVDRVVEKVAARVESHRGGPSQVGSTGREYGNVGGRLAARIPQGRLGVYDDPDTAVAAALRAYRNNEQTSIEVRQKMIAAMRQVVFDNIKDLSHFAWEETGLGRVSDKLAKNKLVAEKTPGMEVLVPQAVTGDSGLMITERAPYGVILAVTPCTNPTETIVCNGIGMVAGGNSVVFNVHPSAKGVCNWLVHLLNEAIISVGGPKDALVSIANPTIKSAQALFAHPNIRLVVVTGGPGVVKAAMASGKKVIGAGPGNPPAVVDETANLENAADAIVRGASIDNNIICTAEKEIVAVETIFDELTSQLTNRGCLLLTSKQVRDAEKIILSGNSVNKKFVGKNAGEIAEALGIRGHGPDLRLLLCHVEEGHPFVQHELLMPVIGMFKATDAPDAIAAAIRVEHGFNHTSVMHSTNIDHMAAMARLCNTSIFVKNDCNLAGLGLGGEGYTSFTIASPTGEGLTNARHFTRERRCTLKEAFRFV